MRAPEPAPSDRHLWPSLTDATVKEVQRPKQLSQSFGRTQFREKRNVDEFFSIRGQENSIILGDNRQRESDKQETTNDIVNSNRALLNEIIRCVNQSKYCLKGPQGKLKWFAADGRPLNSKGLPTFTDEERQLIANRDIEFCQHPDLTLDRWGRPYTDYPLPPLN